MAKRWPDVARLALYAEPLERAAQPVGEAAVELIATGSPAAASPSSFSQASEMVAQRRASWRCPSLSSVGRSLLAPAGQQEVLRA